MSSFLGKTLGKIVGSNSASTKTSASSTSNSQKSNKQPNATQTNSNNASQALQASAPNAIKANQTNKAHQSIFSTSSSRMAASTNANLDAQLTLTHLRKLFYQYLHPKHVYLDQNEMNEKLYQILPLFIKAFGQSTLQDINERFGDVAEFCFACSKLLVNEISKRVQDDLVLVKFFEIKTSDDCTDGSGLLNTVNLLASGPLFLVEIMAKCSLPSRLVMCIYLFICLPEAKESLLDHCEFNARERRILFQRCFQQLLIKLCQYSCTCDELVDADSLKLVFKIITSTCEQHNLAWRQTASDALLTMTKCCTLKSLNYLHDEKCVHMCLQFFEPDEMCASNLLERCQLLITLLVFLKETSHMSQVLLDDFKAASGYKIIVDLAIRLEKEKLIGEKACRDYFYCLEEFVTAGHVELKFSSANSNANMFKVDGFRVPEPSGKGRTVRNLFAFQSLLNIFNKAQTYQLCCMVLDAVRAIYTKDECNYFILESQNLLLFSLEETSIKILNRTNDIQLKFIELLEFIVYEMRFVPCKELISMGMSLQNYNCNLWSINCAQFLLRLLKSNQMYKDALRELGLFEMIVSCLHKFAVLLKEKHVQERGEQGNDLIDPHQKELGFLVMDLVCTLLSHNPANAKLFRELGGARLAHNMVPYKLCRNQALNIVSTLLLSTAGEDDMSTLLGLMHTARLEDLELKNAVLRSLLHTLRESHRTRTVFRKAGGFVYVVSVLISMEGCLSRPAKSPWDQVRKCEIFAILKTILSTLTVSMRYEPANAKFFETEVRWKSLYAAIKLLGCFDATKSYFEPRTNNDFVKRGFDIFETYFCTLDERCFDADNDTNKSKNKPSTAQSVTSIESIPSGIDEKLIHVCHIMRYLYDTAIDSFDKPFNRYSTSSKHLHPMSSHDSITMRSSSINTTTTNTTPIVHEPLKKANSLIASSGAAHSLHNAIDEPFIVHPGAISSILHLLTTVKSDLNEHLASRLQFHMVNLIKNLLRYERNQQIMSNANFIDDLLVTCKYVLNDETHFLNSSIQYMLERLATQYITARNLREYLRLGTVFESVENKCNVLMPLNRVKCLISMSTPRDSKAYMSSSAFVEFNMVVEGFGCIFLPSIAPQLTNAPSIVAMGMVAVGNDLSVNGGIGAGERVFPPQSGLTYNTWIYVDKFGTNIFPVHDSTHKQMHPIRLLTILKHSRVRDVLSSCLTVYLSPKNRSLFVSTEEQMLQHQKLLMGDEDLKQNEHLVKFNCSELFQEGKWLHLVLVWSRAVLKNSTVTLYVNSNLIGTQKLHYINPILTVNSPPANTSIHAVIGTLPVFRLQSPVVWRQGSCYFFEEIHNAQQVQVLYKLGPNYLGSFQSPPSETLFDSNQSSANASASTSSSLATLINEEKIIFGLHAQNIFEMTLAKFRKVYNKNDSKSIAKHLNIPSNESVTPLRIMSNTATQLSGAARTVGGVIIGYMGVRTFQPQPISKTLENIGGVSFLLGLIAMANDVEFLYASVKLLVGIVKSNLEVAREMERINAYQLLGMLFKRKKGLINSHILNLTFSLVIADETGSAKEQAIIENQKAFECLLCDLDIWSNTAMEIQRSLYERFNDLLNDQMVNARLFHKHNMLKRLLFMVKEGSHTLAMNECTLKYIISTIRILIIEINMADNLLKFGQFVAALISAESVNEKSIELTESADGTTDVALVHQIKVRNRLMAIVDEIVCQNTCNKSLFFQEELQRLLGFDWFILFLRPHVHTSTLTRTAKILFTLLLNPQNVNHFKEATYYNGWCSSVLLSDSLSNVSSSSTTSGGSATGPASNMTSTTIATSGVSTPTAALSSIKATILQSPTNESTYSPLSDTTSCSGFQLIQWYFAKNVDTVELYYMLFCLLFDAQRINELPANAQLDLNSICKYVFDKSFDSEQNLFAKINTELALDVSIILLSMIRTLMNESSDENATTKDFAIILLQIFRFVYHNCDEFRVIAANADFLAALCLTLYPYDELTPEQLSEQVPNEIKPFAESYCLTSLSTNVDNNIDSASVVKYKSYLCIHPGRKLVMDFIRDLVYDNIVNQVNASATNAKSIVDSVLLCVLDSNQAPRRNQEFITEFFKTCIDHLLTYDLFNEQSTTCNTQLSQSSINVILQSLFALIDRLVDKLWDGMYRRDAREVFELIIRFMNNLKKKPFNYSNEPLLNAMNRIILYQLSRPCETLNDQVALLEVLQKLSTLKSLVFSPMNNQAEFFACLSHCLLTICESNEKIDTKHLLIGATERVWLELYLNKKFQLEECLKVSINSIDKNPTLDQLKPIIQEPAARIWTSFCEGEKKLPEKIQSQLQAKFQRVTGGISSSFNRVVQLKKPKKEIPRLSVREVTDISTQVNANFKLLKEYMNVEFRKHMRSNEQRHAYLYAEWLKIERDLLRERALWGDDCENRLNKWKLDFTEGPNRQRKRLLPNNDEFYKNYPYRPEVDAMKPNRKYKIPCSLHSKEYFKQSNKVKSLLHFDHDNQAQSERVDLGAEEAKTSSTNNNNNETVTLQTQVSTSNADQQVVQLIEKEDANENNAQSTNDQPNQSSSQNITRLLEDGEKINYVYRCARVQGLDTTEGLFLFGKEHFYVIDGYTLVSTKDIVEIDSLKGSAYEPLIPKSSSGVQHTNTEKTCSKFAYEDIREVHNRRYLLQEIAMEIFSNDGRNYLLVFPRKCRAKIYDRLIALTPDLNDSASQSIAGQRRSINIEQNTGLINALIGEKSVVQRWERGEISNFQYLMFLNTLAGRSYNDLMQYPVFPWILADYESDEVDLNNPSTFRDLSKPMGAQTSDRLLQFEKRYLEWEDPSGETPPYHYGTHYSSAMIVASYLLRLEPFTQIFLRLQGGHFDLADRMFHSIKDNWLSASKNNMADVKELIPEFFYLPDFLVNSNKFDLGKKQSGITLDDVILPPWAKNDAREFIRIHRMALESDYVSAHLNEWIDLIFGYKQQGQAAIDSVNAFHHLFYEGAVNIDEIDDPLKRNAIIGFINNFGQIPKQLFKKPHPTKKLNSQVLYGMAASTQQEHLNAQFIFIHHLKNLKPSLQPIKELKSQIGQIVATDKGLLVVEQNKFLMPPNYQRYVAWGYADESVKIGFTDYEKSYVTFENIQDGPIFCCCSPDSRIIITAGMSTCVNVWEMSKTRLRRLQLKARLYGHSDTVTCMAVSSAYHMLVTGSRDQTCIIWDLNRWTFVRQLPNHYGAVSCCCINELTGDIATASSSYLYLWNINGDLLASVNTITTSRNHLILAVHMSQVNEWDENNVVLTGGTDGVVRMWSLNYEQIKQDEVPNKQSKQIASEEICTNESNDQTNQEPRARQIEEQRDENKSDVLSIDQNKSGEHLKESNENNESNVEQKQREEIQRQTICAEQSEKQEETERKQNSESSELYDDFVLVDKNQINEPMKKVPLLKPGHVWKRNLVFKSKLTMHTSYDRKDNSEPASVTALAISKDNRTIYVGDSRGRVFNWVCTENPGKQRADHWVKDEMADACKACQVKFSFSERRHHCRQCGHVFCNNCSKYETQIPRLHINKQVRVCQTCFNQIKADMNSSQTDSNSCPTKQ